MSRRIGIIGRAFENFWNSLRAPGLKTTLVGSDHHGNKYFEKKSDQSRNLKGARWVERKDGDQWTAPEVPPEWNAWLRGRRKQPPTQEELDQNYAVMMRTIHRAKELEEKESLEGPPSSKKTESEKPYTSTVEPKEERSRFPVYPEYEIQPGEHSENRYKK